VTVFTDVQVLIIEDDEIGVEVLQQLLRRLDIDATAIFPRRDNLQLLDAESPQVVFVDLEMPEMNGYDVLSYLRSHTNYKDSLIVAYSTHISHINRAKKAGFDSFLGKPLDHRSFAEQLERILSGESLWVVP